MTAFDGRSDAVSTLVLVSDEEYVLCASRSRVLFDCYSRKETSREQAITLTLDNGNADSASSTANAAVPIILSAPCTPRFELSTVDAEAPPLESLLSPRSSRTYIITFKPPEVCESDYAWDNFRDQIVVHTRLSKLVVHLEAWKHNVPSELAHDRRTPLMFPAKLPNVKTPPLKRFGVIERNGEQRSTAQRQGAQLSSCAGAAKVLLTPEASASCSFKPTLRESCASLSRPASSEHQPSPAAHSTENIATTLMTSSEQPTVPDVTTIQSLREAHEVILKLRCRRRFRSTTKALDETSPTPRELFPETTALDADTKAELDEFNEIVAAARAQAKKNAAKVKSELAYLQLVPVPPPRDCALELLATSFVDSTTVSERKARQMSAAIKRPSKLPTLVRPASGAASSSTIRTIESSFPTTNQEVPRPDQAPHRRGMCARQRVVRSVKLQSLSACMDNPRSNLPSGSKLRARLGNQQHAEQDAASELSGFDDPDPEVDEAPVLPDDLSGVSTLDADDLYF